LRSQNGTNFPQIEQLKMLPYTPEISASKVAGLIGLHAYQPPHEVMYDLLSKNLSTKYRIADIEARERRISVSKLKDAILRTSAVRDIIGAGVRACVGRTDITDTLADVETQARMVLDLRHSELNSDIRSMLVGEVRGAVQRQRGTNNEAAILDTYEKEKDVVVADRNTVTFRKDYGSFKLVGRTDGYVKEHNRIVDSKARTRWWPAVPMYDEIQLRVYMDLSGASESELVESFPDGRTRTTKYMNDPEKWTVLHTALVDVTKKMNDTLASNDLLTSLVFANTVPV
jgi:hypothetical protein